MPHKLTGLETGLGSRCALSRPIAAPKPSQEFLDEPQLLTIGAFRELGQLLVQRETESCQGFGNRSPNFLRLVVEQLQEEGKLPGIRQWCLSRGFRPSSDSCARSGPGSTRCLRRRVAQEDQSEENS